MANKDVKDVNTETAKEKHGAIAEYKKIFAQCQGQMYFSVRFKRFHCTYAAQTYSEHHKILKRRITGDEILLKKIIEGADDERIRSLLAR